MYFALSPHQNLENRGRCFIPILQRRKLRLREVIDLPKST